MSEKVAAGAQASTEAPAAGKPPAPQGGDGKAAAAAGEKPGEKAGEPKPGEAAAGTELKGKATADQGKAGEPGAQPKAPEKYELKVPEGGDAYIGTEDLKFIEEVARANDWTQQEAQAEITSAVERAQTREKGMAVKFLAELKGDQDYGGEKLETTQRLAKKAIDRIFPTGHRLRERFVAQMNREIIGNNLLYAAALAEVGRMLGEDAPGQARPAAGTKDDAASKLYDHPTSRVAG